MFRMLLLSVADHTTYHTHKNLFRIQFVFHDTNGKLIYIRASQDCRLQNVLKSNTCINQ